MSDHLGLILAVLVGGGVLAAVLFGRAGGESAGDSNATAGEPGDSGVSETASASSDGGSGADSGGGDGGGGGGGGD